MYKEILASWDSYGRTRQTALSGKKQNNLTSKPTMSILWLWTLIVVVPCLDIHHGITDSTLIVPARHGILGEFNMVINHSAMEYIKSSTMVLPYGTTSTVRVIIPNYLCQYHSLETRCVPEVNALLISSSKEWINRKRIQMHLPFTSPASDFHVGEYWIQWPHHDE